MADKKAATEIKMDFQMRIAKALSYEPENLIEMLPQLAMLLGNRKALAEQLSIGNETVIEAMDYMDNQICLLLGIKQ